VVYESDNGNKEGKCVGDGFPPPGSPEAVTGWEVGDVYKGELARAILYVSTAYLDVFECCDTPNAVNGSRLEPVATPFDSPIFRMAVRPHSLKNSQNGKGLTFVIPKQTYLFGYQKQV
jgi:hypothetical protein